MLGTETGFSVAYRGLSAAQTAKLARDIAPVLGPGDVLLLDGPVGAGKTHFARALITARLAEFDAVEDVPSPSFTLVQTYQAGPLEICHADLYRLSGPEEIEEIGLDGAQNYALCLIEWPDRLGPLCPPGALSVRFRYDQDLDHRDVTLHAADAGWGTRLSGVLGDWPND